MSKRRKKPGRKPLAIDDEAVRKHAYEGASMRDCAVLLGCSDEVIRRRYRKAYELGWAQRRQQLRRKQNKARDAGNATMLVWLGKNELDQTDKQKLDVAQQLTFANGIALDESEGTAAVNAAIDKRLATLPPAPPTETQPPAPEPPAPAAPIEQPHDDAPAAGDP